MIAAIHGFCIGLGVDICSACDIRLCSKDTKFSIRFDNKKKCNTLPTFAYRGKGFELTAKRLDYGFAGKSLLGWQPILVLFSESVLHHSAPRPQSQLWASRVSPLNRSSFVGTQVPKITGNDSLARELALTGRFFNPTTAVQLGLVSRVVEGSRKEVLGKTWDIFCICFCWFHVVSDAVANLGD